MRLTLMPCLAFALMTIFAYATAEPHRQLYWGDTHLHTSYSFDAFLNQNQSADPDTAYRWAKGLPVIHPYTQARVQIETPLDFLVVSDHAEGLGIMRAVVNETAEFEPTSWWAEFQRWLALRLIRRTVEEGTSADIFNDLLPIKSDTPGADPVADPANLPYESVLGDFSKTIKHAWYDIVDAAEHHNDPGKFTAILGWEWSSIPTGANLHRVVMTSDGAEKAKQYLPYGSDQSQYPQDLWAWLDQTSQRTNSEFLAIPHNSNVSKGYMFPEVTLKGQPIDVLYAQTRMAWEPVVEVTQIKGDSETYPSLSPNDEFADFEPYDFYMQKSPQKYQASEGDYARSGLKRGLEIEQRIGVNPYKFGMIGSTDAHTGLSSAEENNFWGKMAHDSTPNTKRGDIIGVTKANGWNMAAAGLAGVWASENTRQAIFNAFKRKEVYATTGPRISVRLFAGWNFTPSDVHVRDMASVGYTKGVPMGGDLTRPSTKQPLTILMRAVKDPVGANLDRIQIIKGWVDSRGQSHEKIFNVAWSGNRTLHANGTLSHVGDTVNRDTLTVGDSIGAKELITVWTDPQFDANQSAFYYARVLQVPTPRHSLFDAVALQIEPPNEGPEVIQERAYTSPIWYTP